jgi:hypothetical protein
MQSLQEPNQLFSENATQFLTLEQFKEGLQ